MFVDELRRKMETALAAFDASLPTNAKVKLVTTKRERAHLPDATG